MGADIVLIFSQSLQSINVSNMVFTIEDFPCAVSDDDYIISDTVSEHVQSFIQQDHVDDRDIEIMTIE